MHKCILKIGHKQGNNNTHSLTGHGSSADIYNCVLLIMPQTSASSSESLVCLFVFNLEK